MKKTKIFIITCAVLTLFLAFFLIFIKTPSDVKERPVYNNLGKVSASTVNSGAISSDKSDTINSGDNTYIPPDSEYDSNNDKNKEDDQMTDIWFPSSEMDLDPNSITVFVNKEYNLPEDFVPKDLTQPDIPFDISGYSERKLLRKEAAEAIEDLFAAALRDGYTLYGVSGYRSYKRQKEIFLNNIVTKGKKHTLRYSAAPGTSEHQTGLAMDVSAKSVRLKLVTAFATCPEGKWLAEHAHEYGFIIRYPQDKEDITGYAYEPWHIRYVGKDLAVYLYNNDLTLDEYYNYVPSEDFNYEKKYADLINYKPPVTPTPTPTPVPEEELTDENLPEEIPDDMTDEIPDDIPDDLPDDIGDDYFDDDDDSSSEGETEDGYDDIGTEIEEQETDNGIDNQDNNDLNEIPSPMPTQVPSAQEENPENTDSEITE